MFEIIEMSEDARRLLETNNRGSIHSIYKNTINIYLDDRIISIHPNAVIKSPMSLRMKSKGIDLESFDMETGDQVDIYEGFLKIGTYKFDFRNAGQWNPSLEEIDLDFKGQHDKEYEFIKEILKTRGEEGDLKHIVLNLTANKTMEIRDDDFFSVKVYSALEGFKSGLEIRDIEKSLETLFSILGLGMGLTPSGDDFIMGLMSVLAVSKASSRFIEELLWGIKERLKESLDRTTFLSSELYFYTLEDKYSSIFLDIFKSIKSKKERELKSSLLTLLDMGHSSGGDTLCGIVFGIAMIKTID